jgi:hypothetical protein
MPNFNLSEVQATQLASFITVIELPPREARLFDTRLPVLKREVTFEEVSKRVFRKVCWHCHASPSYARGDGGPGNTGGFGFRAHKLDLSSYQGVMSGAAGEDGARHSIFRKNDSGLPLIVAHLEARRREALFGESSEMRGMPLGFPPLSREEIQLVESWIAQGRPR